MFSARPSELELKPNESPKTCKDNIMASTWPCCVHENRQTPPTKHGLQAVSRHVAIICQLKCAVPDHLVAFLNIVRIREVWEHHLLFRPGFSPMPALKSPVMTTGASLAFSWIAFNMFWAPRYPHRPAVAPSRRRGPRPGQQGNSVQPRGAEH